jgi:anti-sigma regulatory factor (Ser/Thr protein kinase)
MASYIPSDVEPPLGAVVHPEAAAESNTLLPPGSTLILFTDGLVERRGESIDAGLDLLRERAATNGQSLEGLCDGLLAQMVGDEVGDDIAILAIRPLALTGADVRISVPAEPRVLAHLRQTLRRWLREIGAEEADVNELLIACGEAWANAIQHAYGAGEGMVEVELRHVGDEVEIVTRDLGTWRPEMGGEGGRGLTLMRGFTDSVEIETGPVGTAVRMRKRLRSRVQS